MDDPVRLCIENGKLFARIESGQAYSTGGHDVEEGRWYTLAVVKKGTDLRLYVDGKQRGHSTVPLLIRTQARDIAVGGNPHYNGNESLAVFRPVPILRPGVDAGGNRDCSKAGALSDTVDPSEQFCQHLAASMAEGSFIRLLLSSAVPKEGAAAKVVGRCIELKGQTHLSLTFHYATRDEVRNIAASEKHCLPIPRLDPSSAMLSWALTAGGLAAEPLGRQTCPACPAQTLHDDRPQPRA